MADRRVCAVLLIIFLNLFSISYVNSERILGVFLTTSRSHLLIHLPIVDELSKAGHDVTVIAGFPNFIKNSTYKYIFLENQSSFGTNQMVKKIMNENKSMFFQFFDIWEYANKATHQQLNHPTMKKFMQEHGPGSFDLLILGHFYNDYQIGLGGHFKCPIILSWMIQSNPEVDKFVGNPLEVSYVPNLMLGLKQPMTFMNRVQNMLAEMVGKGFFYHYMRFREQKFYEKDFPAERYPSLEEAKKNISLLFVNHHFSQSPIRPSVPATIEIGGINVEENPAPLPKDLANIFDQSPNGVIFFSLGSNVPATLLTEERIQTIYNVFSQLPYTFLWTWSGRDIPGSAKNIHFRNWLPQNSLLAHPKLRLFITHAGGGSVTESEYFAKPMVTIPLFADQFPNAKKVVSSGFGVQLNFHEFTEKTLKDAINEVLENPKYKENVENFSKLFKDRPLKPRESVRFWAEYVLRHKGAKHMQSPAVHMSFIELHSLDVFAFLLAILCLSIYVPIKICKYLCSRHKKQKVKKVKKN